MTAHSPLPATAPSRTRLPKPGSRLVLFDLDHTLLDGDTDVLWCDFLLHHGVLDRASFGERNAAMEAGYRSGAVSPAAFAGFYVSTLAGRSAEGWHALRAAFVQRDIAPRIGAAAHALVLQHQQQDGACVVLTTATNRYLAEPAAQLLGIAHLIATECEVAAIGHFTGGLAGEPNMREGKVQHLHTWLAARGQRLQDFDETSAYSDSANDLPLLQAVQHAVAVNPDPRLAAVAAQRGWPVLRLHAAKA